MEKKIESKEVKLNPINASKEKVAMKLTYEQLNKVCGELSQQVQQQSNYIQQLHKKMQEMSFLLQNRRMDYLFRVVETSNSYKSSDYPCFDRQFVEECLAEIQQLLTIPQKTEEEESQKDN